VRKGTEYSMFLSLLELIEIGNLHYFQLRVNIVGICSKRDFASEVPWTTALFVADWAADKSAKNLFLWGEVEFVIQKVPVTEQRMQLIS
jgi:hypothetical protein